ncbi:hypothetical protein AVEN_153458-1 [Araneus ventricosus]|uniref:Uncharacterized protein n=1 Tax=Araneus ventricosus TaxID=182803 RepID=A0A4Y2V503_ARAVE|nr:hypothetical protein AVEN_209358-1 [Araneus ventricosus]GBO20190.1 hypothetical protein AVEN_130030-1 [Araneus ventricosus]GBO20349.1 hypothetical protein AVEN_153458-1 [Araneus ventricosus]
MDNICECGAVGNACECGAVGNACECGAVGNACECGAVGNACECGAVDQSAQMNLGPFIDAIVLNNDITPSSSKETTFSVPDPTLLGVPKKYF